MKADTGNEDRTGRVFASGSAPSPLPIEGQDSLTPWWQTPYGLWRRSVEVQAMKRFPHFRLHDDASVLCWEGWLRSALTRTSPTGCWQQLGKRYDVTVAYPFGFPDLAPEVTIHNHLFLAGTPHLLSANRPCLFVPDHGPRSGYDPARTTAATIVTWTSLWIHAYETWQATGKWPGQER